MEDTEIIKLFWSRSDAAIAETKKKYGKYINKIAYNILNDRCDSDEIENDTYLAAWQSIPPKMPRVLRHYLSGIARNLAFKRCEYYSAAKRSENMNVFWDELEECVPDSEDFDSLLEAREIGEIINKFLSTLSVSDCSIFVLRYYYAAPIRYIAGKSKLSERQVKYRLSVMRSKLKLCLEKEGISI